MLCSNFLPSWSRDLCTQHPTLWIDHGFQWNDYVSCFAQTWVIWSAHKQGDQSSEHVIKDEYVEPGMKSANYPKRFRSTQLDDTNMERRTSNEAKHDAEDKSTIAFLLLLVMKHSISFYFWLTFKYNFVSFNDVMISWQNFLSLNLSMKHSFNNYL